MKRSWLFFLLPFFFLSAADTPLERSSGEQQQAIHNLIQALKNTRKLIVRSQRPGTPGQPELPNPFTDKQKYQVPPLPPEQNPHEQLKLLQEEQSKLNQEQREAPNNSGELSQKQKKLSEKIQQAANRDSLPDEVKNSLRQAAEAAAETAEQLKNQNAPIAKINGEKTQSDLNRAKQQLENSSNRDFRKTLDQTQSQLEDALDQTQNQAQNRRELRSTNAMLAEAARQQHRSGKQSNAEQLAALANQMDEALKSNSRPDKLLEQIKKIQEAVSGLRNQDRKDLQVLAETAKKLAEYAKELKYLEQHPETMSREEQDQLYREISSTMYDLAALLNRLEAEPDAKRQAAEALKQSRDQLKQMKRRGTAQQAPGFAFDPLVYPKHFHDLQLRLARLNIAAEALIKTLKTADLVYIFNPDDVPEKYRREVSKYFEKLSTGSEQKKP